MKRMHIAKLISTILMMVALNGAHTMCFCLLFEEEMPEELQEFRRH